jgi:CheY-like chemotaxis protein
MSEGTTKQRTILLADDEDCLRSLTNTVLNDRGYNVLSATNAVDALMIADEHDGHIDLLLTDMSMPDMDGVELAVEFRKSFPLSKVVFMTAYHLADAQQQVPNETIVTKPFCIDALCDSIHQVLHQDT